MVSVVVWMKLDLLHFSVSVFDMKMCVTCYDSFLYQEKMINDLQVNDHEYYY